MTDTGRCRGVELDRGWWHDEATFRDELAHHGTVEALALAHVGSTKTLYQAARRYGMELPRGPRPTEPTRANPASPVHAAEPGLRVDFRRGEGYLVLDATPNPELGDVDELVRERGLDPDEWLVDRVKVNEWDGLIKNDAGDPEVVRLRQLTAHLRRRPAVELIFPAVEVAERVKPEPGTRSPVARLVACLGDQQADYHDEDLHRAFLRWAADVQPDELALIGDTVDLPTISRHADRPHWNSTPQRCLDAGYRLLSDYRDVLPAARMRKLRGNHDWRLESELLTRAERMFGIAPAARDGEQEIPAYSIRRLLHLDALGIELVGREGDKWELAEIEIGPGVWARHRPPNEKKHLRLNRDVIAGDTHRQAITQVTIFDDADEPVVRTRVEAGCMCRTDGLGFTEHPDWQPGFVTVALDETGAASYELATWRGGELRWRGEKWKP